MTANITVLVQKVDSVLIIPGKALRFTPDATWLAEYMKNNPMPQRQGQGGRQDKAATGGSAGQEEPESWSESNNQRPQGTGASGQTNPGEFQPGGAQGGKKPVIVWVKNGDKIHRTRVTTGAIDGSNAEIKSGLKEGDEVILSMSLPGKSGTTAAAAPTTTNPFMPTRPGGRGR